MASDLFEQHSEMVLSVCRVLLLDAGEAEDATQQTFLYAYRSIISGSEPQRPAAWLATIARNECLNRLRARMREPHAEAVSGRPPGTPDALNAAIAREDLHALGRTIRELPSQQRDALLLHEFCGLPYRDVAAAIGVSESAIGSLLFRARTRLRAALRRTYAALPIPAVWNAVDHLLARGPVAGTAVPAVAKLGTAAVAVGLTAGAAVVVDQNVQSHHRWSPPPPAHRSVAPVTPQGSKPQLARAIAVAAHTSVAVHRASAAAHRTSPTASPTRHPHAVGAARSLPKHRPQPTDVSAWLPGPAIADATSRARGRSKPPSGEARSQHGSPTETKFTAEHGKGREAGPTRSPKAHVAKPAAKTKTKPDQQVSSPSGTGNDPAVGAQGNGPDGNGPPGQDQQHGNGGDKSLGEDPGNGHLHQAH